MKSHAYIQTWHAAGAMEKQQQKIRNKQIYINI